MCRGSETTNNIVTSYSGSTTTVTDQAGKKRKSETDAQSQKLDFNRSYTYDQLNRIASMFSPGETCLGLNWEYDIWGNRLHQNNGGGTCGEHHPTVNTQNRLTGTGVQYDAAGNLTAEPGKTYQYDAEGRMTSIGNACPTTLCYTYDANGRRIRKRIGSTITDYIYDAGGALVAERQSTNGGSSWTWVKGYVHFSGQLLAQYSNSTTYFAHKDHLGSTRLLTTVSASVHETYDFLPFGEPINNSSNPTTPNQFTGHYRDTESSLDYFGARYFASTTGRFTAVDPGHLNRKHLTYPQKWNKYSYVINNPLALFDPDGREELSIIIRTWIPRDVVVAPVSRRIFAGDAKSGTSRTQQTIRVETDPDKRAQPLIEMKKETGVTQELDAQGNVKNTGRATGDSLAAGATRNKDGTVQVMASGNEPNPLLTSPGITFNFNITVSSNGTYQVQGYHDGFPAYVITVTREDGTTVTIYSHNPNQTGETEWSLFPPAEHSVNKKGKLPKKKKEKESN